MLGRITSIDGVYCKTQWNCVASNAGVFWKSGGCTIIWSYSCVVGQSGEWPDEGHIGISYLFSFLLFRMNKERKRAKRYSRYKRLSGWCQTTHHVYTVQQSKTNIDFWPCFQVTQFSKFSMTTVSGPLERYSLEYMRNMYCTNGPLSYIDFNSNIL